MESNSKVSVDRYGRKVWDVDAYADEAKKHSKKEAKKEVDPQSLIKDDSSTSYLKHRNNLLSESLAAVKQHNLINPLNTSSSYGRNKKFGFFCPICDLSFRDNLALIDHINSPSHVSRASSLQTEASRGTGATEAPETLESGIPRARLDDVVATIETLVKTSLTEKTSQYEGGLSLQDRIQKRKNFEQSRTLKRKQRRIKQRENKRFKPNVTQDHDPAVVASMGFADFGSTKS